MLSEQKNLEKLGEKAGFAFSYLLSTSILFGILSILNKLHGMNYFHILGITLLVVTVGLTITRLLK